MIAGCPKPLKVWVKSGVLYSTAVAVTLAVVSTARAAPIVTFAESDKIAVQGAATILGTKGRVRIRVLNRSSRDLCFYTYNLFSNLAQYRTASGELVDDISTRFNVRAWRYFKIVSADGKWYEFEERMGESVFRSEAAALSVAGATYVLIGYECPPVGASTTSVVPDWPLAKASFGFSREFSLKVQHASGNRQQ